MIELQTLISKLCDPEQSIHLRSGRVLDRNQASIQETLWKNNKEGQEIQTLMDLLERRLQSIDQDNMRLQEAFSQAQQLQDF